MKVLHNFEANILASDNKQIRQGSADTSNALELGAIAAANEKCVEKVLYTW